MSKSSEFSKVKTVSKKEMVTTVAVRTGQTIEFTKSVVDLFLNEIVDELAKGNRIEFRNFGSFSPVTYKGLDSTRNPRTGEELGPSKERKTARFRSSKKLKRDLNEPKL